MDLDRFVINDIDDVTTLYERKLCSLGVVALKLRRGALATQTDRPELSAALNALADQAESAHVAQVSWLEGMELMDRVRALLQAPPVAAPTLSLVADTAGEGSPAPSGQTEASNTDASKPAQVSPSDPMDAPTPSGVHGRTL